jgi:hypothetical protein
MEVSQCYAVQPLSLGGVPGDRCDLLAAGGAL